MADHSESARFVRFLFAGVLNTLFGFAVFSAAIWADYPVWAALVFSNVAGVVFNFFTTGGYAFRNRVASRFPFFALAYLVVYGVNWALIQTIKPWVPGAVAAQALLTVPIALLSYVIMSRLVFPHEKTS